MQLRRCRDEPCPKAATRPSGHLEEDENKWVRCAALNLAAWQQRFAGIFAPGLLLASVLQAASLERAAVVAHVRSLGVEEVDVVASGRDAELCLEDVRDRGARRLVRVGVDRPKRTQIQERGRVCCSAVAPV
jgi:hypothetical protein